MGRKKGSKNSVKKEVLNPEIEKVELPDSGLETKPVEVKKEEVKFEDKRLCIRCRQSLSGTLECKRCSHTESMHYGSADRWCNQRECKCQKWEE